MWTTIDGCSALETGLGTLLASVNKSIESAVNAEHAAAKAVSAHTDLLKRAMDVSNCPLMDVQFVGNDITVLMADHTVCRTAPFSVTLNDP